MTLEPAETVAEPLLGAVIVAALNVIAFEPATCTPSPSETLLPRNERLPPKTLMMPGLEPTPFVKVRL